MLIIQLIQQCLHTTTFADACTAKEQNIFACQNGLQHRVSFLYGERMIADGVEVGLEPMIQTLDLQWDIGIGGQRWYPRCSRYCCNIPAVSVLP